MAAFVFILPVRPPNFLSAAKGVHVKLLDQVRQLARVRRVPLRPPSGDPKRDIQGCFWE